MSKCAVISLFSGSKGNAYLYRCDNTEILIDCGVSTKALTGALEGVGSSVDRIKSIFITHEHIDHTRALSVLLKKHPIPVHMLKGCYESGLRDGTLRESSSIVLHEPIYTVTVGDFTVTSFPLSHDSSQCVGYRITAEKADGAKRVFFHATDTGHITKEMGDAVQNAETCIIESNHDENMLLLGRYPYDLKRRILSDNGHLSNDACSRFAAAAAEGGTSRFLLAHLSEENNYPALAFRTVWNTVSVKNKDAVILVAHPKQAITLLNEWE